MHFCGELAGSVIQGYSVGVTSPFNSGVTMGKLVNQIAKLQDYEQFADLNWSGTFEDYLGIVRENPLVTRTSFQRV